MGRFFWLKCFYLCRSPRRRRPPCGRGRTSTNSRIWSGRRRATPSSRFVIPWTCSVQMGNVIKCDVVLYLELFSHTNWYFYGVLHIWKLLINQSSWSNLNLLKIMQLWNYPLNTVTLLVNKGWFSLAPFFFVCGYTYLACTYCTFHKYLII